MINAKTWYDRFGVCPVGIEAMALMLKCDDYYFRSCQDRPQKIAEIFDSKLEDEKYRKHDRLVRLDEMLKPVTDFSG
jgi:hypothetical protein